MKKKPTEEASNAARALVAVRWKKTTKKERSEFARMVASARTPEQMGNAGFSDKPRCPCGEMTAKRAKMRRHVCEAPKPLKREEK